MKNVACAQFESARILIRRRLIINDMLLEIPLSCEHQQDEREDEKLITVGSSRGGGPVHVRLRSTWSSCSLSFDTNDYRVPEEPHTDTLI